MGFFNKIKAAVGVGDLKVNILLDNEQGIFKQGETVTGKLEIIGGGADQTIDRLSLEFRLKWREIIEQTVVEEGMFGTSVDQHEEEESGTDTLDEIVQDEPMKIAAGSTTSLDFDFPIPYDAAISIEKELDYFLYARADIPNAIDAKCKVDIQITPSAEIQAIEEVLETRLGLVFIGDFSQDGWVMAEFTAPRQKFSRGNPNVGLAMINGEKSVEIEVYPNLDGMSFPDFLRTDVTHEPFKYQIELPYEQIAPNRQQIDMDILEEAFKKVFTDLNWY